MTDEQNDANASTVEEALSPEPAAVDAPDLPVSAGIADAVIAPPVEVAPEQAPAPLPAALEPLDTGEVIRDEREHTIRIDGQAYHHVREATDGRWIYAPVRPRD